MLLINILPFGGLGVWRPARKKRKKMSGVGGVGAAGGAGGSGGVTSSGGAASVAATPADGASATGAEAPGKVDSQGGDTENAEKFGMGNVNMTQNVNITNINMSTQDHLHCREMGQAGGVGQSQESPMIDLKKLIEMMIMLKMLQAFQQQG